MGCQICVNMSSLDEGSGKPPEPLIIVNPSRFVLFKSTPFLDDYEIMNPLGRGRSGIVYEVRHRTSRLLRAMKKILKLGEESSELMLQEVNLLSSIDHPHVMKIFEFYEDDRHFYIVSELLEGGDLFDYIQDHIEKTYNLPEALVAVIMLQLFSAVKCCHDSGVIHRDLKPENIMLQRYPTSVSDLHLKIVDFGASILYTGARLNEKIGTTKYVAPEMLEGSYDKKCDIWSLGVILYVLLAGKYPFDGETVEEVERRICIGEVSLSSRLWSNVSYGAKELLKKLLAVNPAQRISLEDALNDPWILSQGKNRAIVMPAASDVLLNFKRFRGEQKLRQALSAYAVVHFSSPETLARQQDLFKALDTDSSGKLTESELVASLSTQMSPEDAQSEADRIMKKIDMNHSGAVDLTEFQTTTAFVQNDITLAQLRAAFQSLDLDQSGKLSCAELKSVLGRGVTGAEDWRKLVAQADINKDGEIDWNEFISFLVTNTESH